MAGLPVCHDHVDEDVASPSTGEAGRRSAVESWASLHVAAGATVMKGAGRGLRSQMITTTGTGKTLVAARSAGELQATRMLVLVPSLDLLTRNGTAGRKGGRSGPVIGLSSLRGEEAGLPDTTDVDELLPWVRSSGEAHVAETVTSSLGTPARAHAAPFTASWRRWVRGWTRRSRRWSREGVRAVRDAGRVLAAPPGPRR
ncbi:hypothetical protein GCM10010365_22810 [Streptomyces poonensis]|uniref:Helicase/UvrB N-terminal domain-containing protein n=1 Tax=Streptomyces poonensis TaxID=68255 RepID=A0A918PF68_9ACTN|nr:hypothetical protein GCM10010365_22810 [Streptomyces poonensis]GLJ90720.1 hypothetical protein GCM10017589_33250 [Streptomyces poonensis]